MRRPCTILAITGALAGLSALAQAAPPDAATLDGITAEYRTLIEAENRHDLPAVRPMLWQSPDMLSCAGTRSTSSIDPRKAALAVGYIGAGRSTLLIYAGATEYQHVLMVVPVTLIVAEDTNIAARL
jgi:hypothetical protein